MNVRRSRAAASGKSSSRTAVPASTALPRSRVAAATLPRPGGLALVADEVIAMHFDGPGNRVRVWVPE